MISGVLIFSGTAQFVSVAMLSGGSFFMAAVTALMVSARHIFFSISMIGRYRNEGKRKWYLFYALCDESYAMLSSDNTPDGVNVSAYRFFVTLFDQASWVIGSTLGGLLGNVLPFDSTGIDFAMTALFTTVFIEQLLTEKSRIPAILGFFATLLCLLVFGRDYFLIPAMILIIAAVLFMRNKTEAKDASTGKEGDNGA
ncbi:MAG: AzlC family ABC transporter permease [Clostridia bacterium]|nr:AzlC family ABC transporter permease [Clostridia bacterium]